MLHGSVRTLPLIVGLAALAGCHRQPSPDHSPTLAPSPSPTPTPSPTLAPTALPGSLTVPASVRSSDELTAQLTITNRGSTIMSLAQGPLEISLLALEVHNAAGARIPTIPPPVPRPEDTKPVAIAPGASITRDYRLSVFSPALAPGRYTVHCRIVACMPASFAIAP